MVVLLVKTKSGLTNADGRDLMAKAFDEHSPYLRLNALASQSDRDEHEGFRFIFMGAAQGIRNPKAHELISQIDPHRTLEYLALASLLAKRVDDAFQTGVN